MIDIHTHIMPCIDDGSNSIEMSLEMLKEEQEQGITDIILTPHIINTIKRRKSQDEYLRGFRIVENIIKSNDLNIKVYLGGEIYLLDSTFNDLVTKEIHTIENTKNILIELSLTQTYEFDEIENHLYNLSLRYKVILAHPERYHYLRIEEIYRLSKYCMMQVNASSLLGLEGTHIKRRAFMILRNKIASFVASDCHNMTTRKPNLKEAKELVVKKFGEDYAKYLFDIMPEKLINDIK